MHTIESNPKVHIGDTERHMPFYRQVAVAVEHPPLAL